MTKCPALTAKARLSGCVCLLPIVFLLASGTLCQAQAIRFTAFKATNETTDSTYSLIHPISLNYQETHLLIRFMDAPDSAYARYAYRLVGFDTRWYDNGNLNAVNYINLFGGDYELQVKNLNFPDKIAALPFHLEEAFWQRPWFVPMLFSYGLLVLGIILFIIRGYRLRGQRHLQQIRDEIAADLHDDVGTALSSITFLGEMAKSKFDKHSEDIRPILERIMNESREMMQTMRGVVWVINPHNDRAVDYFDKVKSFVEAVLSSRAVALTFRAETADTQIIGLEVQRNLFLIIKEAVVNIAKHAEAIEASVAIKTDKNFLWVQISDNGKGFDEEAMSEGNGLRNLKKRAAQLGGNLAVTSSPGSGTIIKVVLPIA